MQPSEVSTPEFEQRLGALAAKIDDPRSGFCGPRSLSWKVDGEIVLHAAGPRALLMQFAHPMVAQGIADHSNFRKDLFGRTARTFLTVYDLIFGARDEAMAAARRIHMVHKRVRGTLPFAVGCFEAGRPYAANDPALLAWVWSTLIDSALYAYETFVEPLSAPTREAYYQECRDLSALFGVPHDAYPATHDGFVRWIDRRIERGEVAVGPTARELADVFLSGRTGLRPLSPLFTVLASGTLPPQLREQFALPWDAGTRAAFAVVRQTLRAGARVAPTVVRRVPFATRAYWRCRGIGGAPRRSAAVPPPTEHA